MSIQIRHDSRRGCGWRAPGGLYLVSSGQGRHCGKLPVPLHVCATCGQGIKPTRGWTWVDGDALLSTKICANAGTTFCEFCPLAAAVGRAGLLWIGEAFYKTPEEFTREAARLGISRRIVAVPKGFVLCQTWVLCAHRKAIVLPDGKSERGIFYMFRPDAVEYVTKGHETPEEIEALENRGITPVKVLRRGEEIALPEIADEAA